MVPTTQAMEMAREAQLDLVEVAPLERPPVCKIMDFGKFRYQQTHKKAKNKPHQQKLKEIRVRPKTGDHDIEVKVNQARKFLEHKDKVLVNVLFRGRELQHIEEGKRIIVGMLEKLADLAKVDAAITRLVDVVDRTFEVEEHRAPGFGMAPNLPRPAKHD